MPQIDASRLEPSLAAVFSAAGADGREAALIARHLVEASLRGHDSHGVGLTAHYCEAIAGRMRLGRPLALAPRSRRSPPLRRGAWRGPGHGP